MKGRRKQWSSELGGERGDCREGVEMLIERERERERDLIKKKKPTLWLWWVLSKDKLRDAIPRTLFHISFSLSLSPPLIKVQNPSWSWGGLPLPNLTFSCDIHSFFIFFLFFFLYFSLDFFNPCELNFGDGVNLNVINQPNNVY